MSRMQSAVITAPGRVELRSVRIPEPGPTQVRVRMEGCGVCGSNIPVWEGRPWFTYPLESGSPGHEGWGIIDTVGDDVVGLREGERVSVLSFHAFAEYDLAEAAAVVPIPEEMKAMPCPGEPLGCAMNVFKRSEILPGQTIAVIGIGFLGALVTSMAAQAGAKVIAISRRPFALQVAAALGAWETIRMDDHWRIIEEVREITDNQLCDTVIESVGLQWPLDLAAEITCERGRLVVAGYHQDGPRQVNMQLWNWRGLDVINAHERDPAVYTQGTREAISAIHEGRLRPQSLFTHCFHLNELSGAFAAMQSRPETFMKAYLTF